MLLISCSVFGIDQEISQTYFEQSYRMYQEGNLLESQNLLDKSLDFGSSGDSIALQAQLDLSGNDEISAEENLKESLKLKDRDYYTDDVLYDSLIPLLIKHKKYDEALGYYEDVESIIYKDSKWIKWIIDIYIGQDRRNKALYWANEGDNLYPDDFDFIKKIFFLGHGDRNLVEMVLKRSKLLNIDKDPILKEILYSNTNKRIANVINDHLSDNDYDKKSSQLLYQGVINWDTFLSLSDDIQLSWLIPYYNNSSASQKDLIEQYLDSKDVLYLDWNNDGWNETSWTKENDQWIQRVDKDQDGITDIEVLWENGYPREIKNSINKSYIHYYEYPFVNEAYIVTSMGNRNFYYNKGDKFYYQTWISSGPVYFNKAVAIESPDDDWLYDSVNDIRQFDDTNNERYHWKVFHNQYLWLHENGNELNKIFYYKNGKVLVAETKFTGLDNPDLVSLYKDDKLSEIYFDADEDGLVDYMENWDVRVLKSWYPNGTTNIDKIKVEHLE